MHKNNIIIIMKMKTKADKITQLPAAVDHTLCVQKMSGQSQNLLTHIFAKFTIINKLDI